MTEFSSYAGAPAERPEGGPAAEAPPAPSIPVMDPPLPEIPDVFHLLVSSVRDYAIFALDATGRIMTWNEGAQRIKGYAPHEIIGRHFSTFYPAEDRADGKPAWELEVAEREGRVEDEGWRIRKDGTRFWANVVITALRDANGTLVGFGKVTRDLSERRRAEEELRESEERFRLLVQSVKDYAIFMLDPDGCVASWNEGAERIKGYTAGEIIGRHFSVFYPPEEMGKTGWKLEVAQREGRVEDEGWRVRKDGTRFWANVIITALRDRKGRLRGYAKVTRDLTERRAAQIREVEDARRLASAEASNRAKSEFLASMSHELRTPLNAIGGYVDLLAMGVRGPVSAEQLQDLERVRAAQLHLLAIINDILNFSRLEAGHVHFELEAVHLVDALAAVMPMVEVQAREKGLEVVRAPCPPDLAAYADRTKLEQILLNLASNAVKFTGEGGRVTLACEERDGRVAIRVTDTGPGIPPEKRESIFEPFVQLGRSLTSGSAGTGLGLAISRDLARGMGGELWVEGEEGEGATFALHLPRP
ncbi:MAG TPA: PAS domain-containing sensor histidine kinase [Longimicrobium sp.]|nr:PAS domain-containing sensor histidine kinase [Longimicrobium sp.]